MIGCTTTRAQPFHGLWSVSHSARLRQNRKRATKAASTSLGHSTPGEARTGLARLAEAGWNALVDDCERVRAALEGDPAALHELVVALTPVVQARVARALLRRRDSHGRDIRQDVEDLTQEVFLAMFTDDRRFLRSWKPALGLSLPNFVGLLAQRRVASIMRTAKRTPWSDEAPLNEHDAADQHPEQRAQSRQLLSRVLDRLKQTLSPRGFELFVRLYVREESVAAVSEAMAINPNAVHQWRHRLGSAARAALDELSESPAPLQEGGAPGFDARRTGVEP